MTIHTMMTEEGFHQQICSFDGEVWELRGVREGETMTVYTKRDGRWYRSTATLYEFGDSPYEWELPFGVLFRDEETNLYTYEIGELNARLEMGFREGQLVYAGVIAEDTEEVTEYSEFGTTSLPEFSLSLVVPGIILDANGDIVE